MQVEISWKNQASETFCQIFCQNLLRAEGTKFIYQLPSLRNFASNIWQTKSTLKQQKKSCKLTYFFKFKQSEEPLTVSQLNLLQIK